MKQAHVVNDKELRTILNSTKMTRHQHRNQLMVMLSYCAGLRACEISSLRIGDIIGSDGEAMHTILLERLQTKGTPHQQVVVSKKLRKEITRYAQQCRPQAKPQSPLLSSQKCGAFCSQTIQQVFRQLYTQIGFDGASSHSGRRTMLTKLAEWGVHARVIQHIARHSSLVTTKRYKLLGRVD